MKTKPAPTASFACHRWLVFLWLSLSFAHTITSRAQFSYTTNNGTATITGYSGPGGAVNIPDTIAGYAVTSLEMGKAGFQTAPVTSVNIPNSVTNIGANTFAGCSLLTTVTIPDGVVSIGNFAFSGCTNLGSVSLGSNVMTLGLDLFLNCRSLTQISASGSSPYFSTTDGILFNKNGTTLVAYPPGKNGADYAIANGVNQIATCAFESCTKLHQIIIPGGVVAIGARAFTGCIAVTNLVFPGTLTSIGDEALQGCAALATISLPNSVTNIGTRGFIGCVSLRSLTIPDGLKSLGAYLFAGCTGLTNLTFGTGLTNISYAAFEYCSGLNRMRLPRSLQSIGFGAFSESGLVSLIVPDTVAAVGSFAFERSSSLKQILFLGNAPTPDANALYNCNPTIYYLPGTTGWSSSFAGKPAFEWNPQILTDSAGIQNNAFGFSVTGNPDLPIIIEAASNLAAPAWSQLQSGTLTNGLLYFSDPDWANHSSHFYRVGFQ